MTKITGTLHEDLRTFMTCRRILLTMGNVSDESCRENQNKNLYAITFFSPENRAVFDIKSKNKVESDHR
jgi:hypothetical protein